MFQDEYAKKFMANKLPIESGRYGKTEKEFLQRCQHYYGLYASNGACFGFGGITPQGINFKELRDYAAGLQSPAKYRNSLDPPRFSKKKNRHFHRWNISWRVNPTLPKHVDRMKSRFKDISLTPIVTATDEASVAAKEFIVAKMKLLADPRMQAFAQATGRPLPGEASVKGMSPDDISTYYEMGGIALPPELAMKDAIDDMQKLSGWNTIAAMMVEDKIKLGAYCGHIYRQGNKLKVEYIDPAMYFRRPSEYPDGRDSDFKAFIKRRRISEIRQYVSDEKILEKIASNYSWTGKKDWEGKRIEYDRSGHGAYSRAYDDMTVEEMTLYFVDTQIECYAKGRHKRGASVFEPIAPDVKFEDRHQRERVEIPVQYLFKCRWVIGTECVYDFGVADTIVRDGEPGSKDVVFPIFDHISQEPSLIERCIGFEDDKQIATFKIRNLLAKLPPGPRMWIDKTGLRSSVNMGDEEFSFLDILKDYAATGVGVFEREEAYDLPGAEGNSMRNGIITFVQSGIVEDINILRSEIKEAEENIRQATGQNPLEDGIGKSDMLRHTAESMTAGMNAALAPHIEDFISGYERMCYIACQKWRLMVLNGDIVVGNEKKTVLTKELFHRDWNVSASIDNARSKDILLQDLVQNKGAIPPEAYYEIYNTIMNGDIKKAQILLTKASSQAQEMAHKRALEVQQAQAEGNMQAGIATEKEKANTSVTEMNNSKELEAFKADLAEKKAKEDHKRAKEMAELNAKLNFNKDVTVAGIQAPVRAGT